MQPASSGRGLGQELQRVDQLAVGENFVVQVRAGRAAGRADVADDVAALDVLARLDVERAQMAVARRQAEAVLEDDQVAVVAGVRRRLDRAVGRRVDRLALVGGDVDALMKARLAGERIAAAAERAGQPAVRRPDRRRRGGQRFAPLDVAAHVAQPALEALQQIAQHAERVFRRRRARPSAMSAIAAFAGHAGAAGGARLHDGRQLLHRARLRRIERARARRDR